MEVEASKSEFFELCPSGFQGGYKGGKFQLKLLQLFSLRAYKNELDFNIWTEDEAADKFDDLLMTYTSDSQTRFTFLQAKHRVNQKSIELSTLFNDKNYDLYKYFKSFELIESNFNIDQKQNCIDDLILSTNNVFPNQDEEICVLTDNTSNLHFKLLENHAILKCEGKLFKLDKAKEDENFDFLKLKFLSIDLAKLLFDPNSKTCLIQRSRDFLKTNVFDIEEDSISFQEEFINSEINYFKILFKDTVANYPFIGNQKRKLQNDFQDILSEFKFSKSLIEKINNFTDDPQYIEHKIKTFMDKLLFVTETSESVLDRSISLEILSLINDSNRFDSTFLLFDNFFEDWLCPKKEEKTDNMREKLNRSKLSKIFEPIIESNIFKTSFKFSTVPQKLNEFFDPSSDTRSLIYEVSKGETFYGCLKVYTLVKSIIHVNSEMRDLWKISETFKKSTKDFCLVVDAGGNKEILKNFITEFEKGSKAKLVIFCEDGKSFSGDKKLIEGETLCGQLATKSLDLILEKTVQFQGVPVKLKDLIEIDQLKKLSLKQIENFTSMGTSLKSPEIYLPRNLSRSDCLTEEVLEKLNPNFLFDEAEFEAKKNSSVHLLEKSQTTELIWKKSSQSLEPLRLYIDKTKSSKISDENFLKISRQINVVSGVPGMGKSLFLDNLSCELKKRHEYFWIQKLELQTYIDEFQNFEDESIGESDLKEISNYFIDRFLKLEPVETTIIENLFRTGRVILLCDGFDEIGDNHKEILLKIIFALKEFSEANKFYITTRPEWTEFLENRFIQFSFFFQPFTPSDQENYLLKYWDKDSSWSNVAKDVLEKLNDSITDRERTFTGIPLITRLVGDFFMEKLKDDKELKESLATNLSFYELLQFFVNRKFEICCTQKLSLKKSNPIYKKQFKSLRSEHIKLAFQLIYPKSTEEFFSHLDELDEDAISEFVRCGLVQFVNGKLKFIHQTIAEFFVVLFFKENFEKSIVLKFLFEVVLAEKGYQMIRFLIDSVIKDFVNEKTKQILSNLIIENRKVLFVAAEESNFETIETFIHILCETMDGEAIQNLLIKKDADDCNLLYHLFYHCEIKNMKNLDKIYDMIGPENTKMILKLRNGGYKQETILHVAAMQGKNYLDLSKWIFQKFSNDPDLIQDVFLARNFLDHNVLHKSVLKFDRRYFMEFLETLKSFDDEHQTKLLENLLLQLNGNEKTFIYQLIERLTKAATEDEAVEILMELLKWIQHNTKVFKEFVQVGNFPLLHQVAFNFKKSLLKVLKFLLESIEPTEILLRKDDNNAPFFFYVFRGNWENLKPSEIFITVFEFLKKKLPNFDIDGILNEKSKFGNNFLVLIFSFGIELGCEETACEILDWIKDRNLNLCNELIFNKNKVGENFIHIMCRHASKDHLPKIFKSVTNYLTEKIPGFKLRELLIEKDEKQNSFLNFISFRVGIEHPKLNSAKAACEILKWLSEIDFSLTKELIFGKDHVGGSYFLHDLCKESDKTDLPDMFKVVINFLLETLPDFDLNEYLNNKNSDGNTCIDLIDSRDSSNQAKKAKLEIENWVQNFGFNCGIKILPQTKVEDEIKSDVEEATCIQTEISNESSDASKPCFCRIS